MNEKTMRLWPFYVLLKKGDTVLICSGLYNALYCIDLSNGKLTFVSSFKEERAERYLFSGGVHVNNKIICCPVFADKIHILDENDYSEIESVPFRNIEEENKGFYFAGLWEENIYLVRYDLEVVTTFNVNNHDINRIAMGKRMQENNANLLTFIPTGSMRLEDGKMLIAGRNSGSVFCMDLSKGEVSVFKEFKEKGFGSMIMDNGTLYLLPIEKDYIISVSDEEIEHYQLEESINVRAAGCVKNGEEWVVGNPLSNKLIKFNLVNKTVNYVKLPERAFNGNLNGYGMDNSLLIYGENLFVYYMDEQMVKQFYLSPVNEMKRVSQQLFDSKSPLKENLIFQLNDYLWLI